MTSKWYDCSGPEANQWARIIHDMIMGDWYEDIADTPDGCLYARSGWYVAVCDEYGFRTLHKYKNNNDALVAFEYLTEEAYDAA